ncbi:MAG: hypothetical protein AVO33_06900 [delta proteobacterium ML8_F1]|nr:MAG: hypothetical protein AVO33_06900 [delta proteobacterium ML8_F1]
MEYSALLKEHGIQVTKHRIEIIALLKENETRFIGIDEIQARVGSDFSTAYRALELFNEKGIIARTKIEEKLYYSFRCQKRGFHHHLICVKCGRKVDLDFCPVRSLEERYRGIGFSSFEHIRDFFGICEACQDKLP